MRHRADFLVAVIIASLAACDSPTSTELAGPHQPALAVASTTASLADSIRDRYLIRFRDGTASPVALAGQLVHAHGGKLIHAWEVGYVGFNAELSPAAADALRRVPAVMWVHPDGLMSPVGTRDASLFWHLDRIDHRWYQSMDGLYTYEHTGAGVYIYIIDTGITASPTEFGSRLQTGYNAYLRTVGNTGDVVGHGTGVAAVAAGAVHGVASGANIVPVKISFDALGHTMIGDFIDGINWVTAHHVSPAVANISYGVKDANNNETTSPDLDYAVNSLIQAGVTVTVAAGNTPKDACDVSPARVSAAITVGASNIQDTRASFSNWGNCVDLYAPGENIRTLTYDASEQTTSGTSFATPAVAGVAAIDLEQFPSDNPSTVTSVIMAGTGSANPSGLHILYSLVPIQMAAGIDGPSIVSPTDFCMWNAAVSGGHGPYSYQWSGLGSGTGSSIQMQVPATGDLTLDVRDQLGGHWVVTRTITSDWNQLPGCTGPPIQN